MRSSPRLDRGFLAESAGVVVVVAMIAVAWAGVSGGIWADVDVYVMGAQRLLRGDGLYSGATVQGLPFTYSPFAALLLTPLTILSTDAARHAFTVVSGICFAVIVILVSTRLGLGRRQTLVLAGLGIAIEPTVRTLLLGQINFVIVALVLADWTVVPRKFRGYLTGIATGIKVTPGAFVILAILQKDWPTVRRLTFGFFATVAIGLIVAPRDTLAFWLGGFSSLDKFGAGGLIGGDNQSLLGGWMRLFGVLYPSDIVKFSLLAVGLGLGAVAAWLELRTGRDDAELAAFAWISLGALLGSPLSWSHHWVYLIVVFGVLLKRKHYVALSVSAALFWFPTIWLTHPGNFRELLFTPTQKILSLTYCVVAVVLLLQAIRSAIRGGRSRPREVETAATGSPFPQEKKELRDETE